MQHIYAGTITLATIDFEGNVSIENYSDKRILKLIPNPAKNFIELNLTENAILNIYNLSGKKVKSVTYITNDIIDISELNSGVYFIEVNFANNTLKERVKLLVN